MQIKILIIALVCAFTPPALFWMARTESSPVISGSKGYAALVFDQSCDDAEISRRLKEAKIKGVISASEQTVYLNVFSGLKELSLDSWFDNVESYDPRNDGYAEKALAIFVNKGKRRVFIPASQMWAGGDPGTRFSRILEGIEFKLDLPDYRAASPAGLIVFIICAVLFIMLARKIGKITGDSFLKWYAVFLLPALALLSRAGTAGFALCAAQLAMFQILRPAVLRFITAFRFCSREEILPRLIREIRPKIFKTTVLFAVMALILFFSPVSIKTALSGILCVFFAFITAVWAEARRGKIPARVRYIFVPIQSSGYHTRRLPALPLPFLAGMAASFIIALFSPAGAVLETPRMLFEWNSDEIPSYADFERHFEFQNQFAYKKLGGEEGKYLRYTAGENELLSVADIEENKNDSTKTPEWTLKPLAAFLKK
ncbi:MAG: hypothetical protein Pg6A_09180 [Termitinemataceae bacterium]|nr:MAG: hypothetical protein Pg6A_09180 [Termitinemataceae bacterium]